MEDMTERAIGWVRQQKALVPDKPFFVYFAPGATHAPHHVPQEWADKYKSRFDAGWDTLREEIFARQKKLGVIPKDAQLTARPKEIPAWKDMPEKLRPVLARQMEIYAGFLEYADFHVGRLIDSLEKMGVLEDTLVYYIIGDNGASAEGTLNGTLNEGLLFNGISGVETPEYLIQNMNKLGTPESYNHYAVGWAHAMDTPYQWTKQVASHYGGTRNGCIVHWPNGISAQGEVRSQFSHVIDVAPTILEAANLPQPVIVHGVQQTPMQGVSMRYSFDDAKAPERHETQYFEMFGNRGIYHRGWTAVTKHRTPWASASDTSLENDVWELYDTTKDWTQARESRRRAAGQAARAEAALPHRGLQVLRAAAGRPRRRALQLGDCRTARAHPGQLAACLGLHAAAQRELGAEHQEQVALRHRRGGGTGGRRERRHHHPGRHVRRLVPLRAPGPAHLLLQLRRAAPVLRRGRQRAGSGHAPGPHGVQVRRRRRGQGRRRDAVRRRQEGGPAAGWSRPWPTCSPLDETTDVGVETGSHVAEGFHNGDSKFTGRVKWVQLDKGKEDFDHFISRQELFKIAMARQ